MNRQERRRVEKQLGLNKVFKNLTRKEKFDLMQERIETGRQKEAEMKENVRVYVQQVDEDTASKVIFTMSETIAKVKKIPVIDAQQEAELQYNTLKEKQNKNKK